MSNEAGTGTVDTGEVKATGTEITAIGAAEGVVAEGAAAAAAAAEVKPAEGAAGAGEGQTALAAAEGAETGEAKPDGEKKDGEGEPGEKKEGEDTDGAAVVEQALAEVELPEGIVVSDADKGAVAEIAKAHNLPKDAVRDLIALQTKREQARLEAAKTAQQEFVGKMKSEALKLPKETLVAANKFVQKYGSDGAKAKFSDPAFYIGNDVDIINLMATAQKAVDGGFVDGAAAGGGAAKSTGDVLYKT